MLNLLHFKSTKKRTLTAPGSPTKTPIVQIKGAQIEMIGLLLAKRGTLTKSATRGRLIYLDQLYRPHKGWVCDFTHDGSLLGGCSICIFNSARNM